MRYEIIQYVGILLAYATSFIIVSSHFFHILAYLFKGASSVISYPGVTFPNHFKWFPSHFLPNDLNS